MPIVGEGKNVHVEYQIPEDILQLITDEFLKEFRNQLFRIHKEWALDTFAENGIPMNTSTSCWYAAFGKACLLTHCEDLYNYWRTLTWYDSDIFDGELAELLIDRHFILDEIDKVIKEQLGIESSDLRTCCDCGKIYSKDMVVKKKKKGMEDETSEYRCLCCNDIKNTKDGNKNATDYYRGILKELDKFKEQIPVKEG